MRCATTTLRPEVHVKLGFLVSWGGVRLGPFGTSATNWPIAPAPDDRWWWVWSGRRNEDWQGKPKFSEKTCSSATFSTTYATWPDLGSNPGRRGGKPATNSLSYGTVLSAVRLVIFRNVCGWKNTVSRDSMPHNPSVVNWRFTRICHLHLQNWIVTHTRKQHENGYFTSLSVSTQYNIENSGALVRQRTIEHRMVG
jgi:hypothetical protein